MYVQCLHLRGVVTASDRKYTACTTHTYLHRSKFHSSIHTTNPSALLSVSRLASAYPSFLHIDCTKALLLRSVCALGTYISSTRVCNKDRHTDTILECSTVP